MKTNDDKTFWILVVVGVMVTMIIVTNSLQFNADTGTAAEVAMGEKSDLGDFGTFEVKASPDGPMLVYRYPAWLQGAPESVRLNRVRLDHKTYAAALYQGYVANQFAASLSQWETVGKVSWARHHDGTIVALARHLSPAYQEKAFFVRVGIMDENDRWEYSKKVPINLHGIRKGEPFSPNP